MYRTLFLCCSLTLMLASCGPADDQAAADSLLNDTTLPQTLRDINKKLRENPDNLDLYNERARYFMDMKKYAEAEADMKRIMGIDSNNTKYLMTNVDLCFFQNKTGRAKQLLERVLRTDPKNADARLRLGELYIYVRQYQPALYQLDTLLMQNENNARAYFMKGMVFKETGDTAKAVSSMQTAVEQDPDYYNAYIQLGILHAAKHSKLAVEYYMNALKIQPNSEEAIYNLGKFYQDEEQYAIAIETYTTLLKVNPRQYNAYYNIGAIQLEKMGKYEEAIKNFNLAIEAEPRDPRAVFARGLCYERLKNTNKAIEDYRQVLTLDPEYESARVAIDRILGKGK